VKLSKEKDVVEKVDLPPIEEPPRKKPLSLPIEPKE